MATVATGMTVTPSGSILSHGGDDRATGVLGDPSIFRCRYRIDRVARVRLLALAFRSKALKLAPRWPSETSPKNTVHHMHRLVTTTPANMSCRHLLFALKSETRKTGGNIVLT